MKMKNSVTQRGWNKRFSIVSHIHFSGNSSRTAFDRKSSHFSLTFFGDKVIKVSARAKLLITFTRAARDER